jgi:hypothetical protein
MNKIVFVLCSIFLLISCKETKEEPVSYGTIQGWAFICSTNEVVPGLTVTVPNYGSRITDAEGYFKFENVKVGLYPVNIYQDNRYLDSQDIRVNSFNTQLCWFGFEYDESNPDFIVQCTF